MSTTLFLESSETPTFRTQQQNTIQGTDNPEILFGTPGNDQILALGGDDIIFGTRGTDVINGGDGFDTVNYATLGEAVTLLPRGGVGEEGEDSNQLVRIEKIVGAPGQQNAIDASGGSADGVTITADLSANSITINNIPGLGSQTFTIENFVNVIGTPGNDSIVGNFANNMLDGNAFDDSITGGGGNDTVIGGDGDDLLLGTNQTFRGVGEQDLITGGGDTDKFILGDTSGSYYKAAGQNDFARIEDFSFGEQIQLGTGETYNTQLTDSGFDLFAVTAGGNELIANVQFPSGITSRSASNTIMAESTADLLPEGDFQIASGQTLGIFVGA